ncbi:MAG TPA: serpin family protein [Sedimentisphaerales bacterium]|nr:serpin family protein [Sedimentisphaerales bacterium]
MKAIKCMLVLAVVMTTAANCRAVDEPTAREKTNKQLIVTGNNKFALELYAKLCSKEGNLFFSPYSISTALAMAHAGARGVTESQMAGVLHFPVITKPDTELSSKLIPDRHQFASVFAEIIKDLNNKGKKGGYELRVANALWGQEGYEFLEEFLELIKNNYDGRLNEVDFVRAAETARKTINTWVEKETNNKIKNLIQKGMLDSMTRLVLTNAIYFKGNWARQFKEDRTKEAPFTLANGRKVDVAMMNQTAEFNYMETEDFQGLELPYVNDELSMIILLPKEFDGLDEFEKRLTAENLSKWMDELHNREVSVSVPKFKMTSQFGLASVLKSMGMTDAFSPNADFSGMNGKRDLFISAVIHKAYVDVNEEGTEAAAATAVTMKLTSVGPTRIPVFRADHPFLFIIRDNHSGSILFIGRVMNPKA